MDEKLQTWYENMQNAPGIYDGLEGFRDVTPGERLHEAFLKRLYGNTVRPCLPFTNELGNVEFTEAIAFDYDTLKRSGMTTTLPFTSDVVPAGTAKIDWQLGVVSMLPDGAAEPLLYTIGQFRYVSVSRVRDFKLELWFLLDVVKITEDFDKKSFISYQMNLPEVREQILKVHEKYGGDSAPSLLPRITSKAIAEITGVQESTLSNLRNGKKSVENMSFSVLSVLSQFSELRSLDDSILMVLSREPANDVDAVYTRLCGVVVLRRDGTRYRMEASSEDTLYSMFEELVNEYDDEKRSLVLINATDVEGVTYDRLMIPKEDIETILIEEWHA